MNMKTSPNADRKIICNQIMERLLDIHHPTKDDLNKIKMEICRGDKKTPRNSEILSILNGDVREKFLQILSSKSIRIISGVNVVAVMTAPSDCPHGKCVYCPGGLKYDVPSSYTGHEPATMRGIENNFDPYLQVKNRIDQLKAIGHDVSKVDLIVMGGTFLATSLSYQEFFVKGCLDAITDAESHNLEEAKHNAERSEIRNVGITFETRPDYCGTEHVDRMLNLGVTRVELGVQNIYDDIYRLVERGHLVKDVVNATRVLKDSGLKVCYHMMPGLPGSNFERDLEGFKTIFSDSNFKPDMLKIYPSLVVESAKIYEWWKNGKYSPYTNDEASQLIIEVKKTLPPWVRVMRIQRDIPAQLIAAGVNRSNLRQIVQERMRQLNLRCHCIRCREVGQRMLHDGVTPNQENIKIVTRKYEASGGLEVFISAEDEENDILIGYARLRFPSPSAHRKEVTQETSIIRELHIYGPLAPLGVRADRSWQHRGYGRMLLSEAEKISLENGHNRVLITSAIGVREYFKRLGYKLVEPYMMKVLN